jgi:hypothetical protein
MKAKGQVGAYIGIANRQSGALWVAGRPVKKSLISIDRRSKKGLTSQFSWISSTAK